mgnify:CR=1 FL=1
MRDLTFEQHGDEFFVCLDCCIGSGFRKPVSKEFFETALAEFADDIESFRRDIEKARKKWREAWEKANFLS